MDKKTERQLNPVQKQLFNTFTKIGMIISLLSLIGNVLTNVSYISNIKWVIMFLLCVLSIILLKNKKINHFTLVSLFVFIILIFVPLAYIDSGGSGNNAIGYTFLLMIVITYLFNQQARLYLVGLLIFVFILMNSLEYIYPQLISEYPAINQFLDRIIQIPFILIVSFFIIQKFSLNYEQINHHLNLLVDRDYLTGLYNRRRFNNEIEKAALGNIDNTHLALLDMDYFKLINDKHGHLIGDEVLKQMAKILIKNFNNQKHVVSRWGGDEFSIIFYGEKNDLDNRLNKVKTEFHDYIYDYCEKAGFTTSVISFGEFKDIKEALVCADELLYQEKTRKKSS